MKGFKRLATSLTASLDWIASQVENHEALVDAALKEVQQSSARAKVQIKRVQADGQNMRLKLRDLRIAEEQWRERAKNVYQSDEKKAIECARRYKRVQQDIATIEVQEREHSKIEKQLREDLTKIEERYLKLKQQRNLLKTRESRALALSGLDIEGSTIVSEIEDIFDRWEAKVLECETKTNCGEGYLDDLEQEFCTTEEEAELRTLLNDLVK